MCRNQCPRNGVPNHVLVLLIVAGSVLALGCSNDAPKSSLFEEDHVVAEHWPTDLADLAVKLRERAGRVATSSDDSVSKEIRDLVGWVGEVAADTNLSEDDWVPLYEKGESVAAMLSGPADGWNEEDLDAVESLCRLIDESIPKIPDQLPGLAVPVE
ncbi:MAG: hypothetical protein AAGA03_08015 [Planctomycetota bacterium]